jgi:hypothetical protein
METNGGGFEAFKPGKIGLTKLSWIQIEVRWSGSAPKTRKEM